MGVAPSTYTGCSLCADPYYADVNGNCVMCDITCTSCTGVGACSSCASNLVRDNMPRGYCVPNPSDPNLVYYGPTDSAVSCLSLISNCLSCGSNTLACSSCGAGTFLNGTICQNCDPACSTCDALGCTGTCPTGLTYNTTSLAC